MAVRLRPFGEERFVWVWLTLAMVCAAVLILWLNRGTTFWLDEILWYLESPGLGLRGAVQPHLGHLVPVSRVTYAFLLGVFDSGYLPFRLLSLATLLLTDGLLFAYMRRRVGGSVALAPCVVLLFFGPDWLHLLMGNGFTVLLAVSCGVGAFFALEWENRRGDLIACVLLCLGVATYSIALGFLAGAATWILVGRDRWRRVWVFAVPLLPYVAWWLWSRTVDTGVGSGLSVQNLLLIPAWSFQSLSSVLSSLVGLSHQFPGGAPAPQVGSVLAIAALVAVGLRLRAGSVPRALWAAIAVVLTFWVLGAVTAGEIRFPENPRYLFPMAVGVFLIGAESLRGVRWSRAGVVALYLAAAASISTNLIVMRDQAAWLRNIYSTEIRATFTALDVAGPESAYPRLRFYMPDGSSDTDQNMLAGTLAHLEERGEAVRSYFVAAKDYGSLGYSLTGLRSQEDQVRARADMVLAEAMRLKPIPVPSRPRPQKCRSAAGAETAATAVSIPHGGALIEVRGAAAPVSIGRFADGQNVPLGELSPSMPVLLTIPVDRAPEPWRASAGGGTLIVCPLR